jgi:hypothetical protein
VFLVLRNEITENADELTERYAGPGPFRGSLGIAVEDVAAQQGM